MKAVIWTAWIVMTASIFGYLGYTMVYAEDKSDLLIGEASHGHFQIELACTSCHTDAFGGEEVIQEACVNCHEAELKAAHDSHPMKKFNDPRNADTLEILDARYCVTCHTEHQKDQTHPMGLTIPEDYCYHCHQDVLEERESHKGLAFDSCASAGCHNYHDNRALYERFLVENAGGPWVKAMASIVEPNATYHSVHGKKGLKSDKTAATKPSKMPNIPHWDNHLHHSAGIACSTCHQADELSSESWVAKPEPQVCQQCHEKETQGYLESKHGMRLAQGLSAMTPAHSQLEFLDSSADSPHHCTSCHNEQKAEPLYSSLGACLSCHNDDHSTSFMDSPHGQLASKAIAGEISESEAVTCATCHLPTIEDESMGEDVWRVQHNQNDTLRPNEKMIRPVCMSCHSLDFSIDALADPALINNNFSGQPASHVPSIDWALERESK